VERNPLYVKGFRQGEKDGYVKEKVDVKDQPDIYQLGYKRGYQAGFWRLYSEKLNKGLAAAGEFMGGFVNLNRR